MIPEKSGPETLWEMYYRLQKHLLDEKVDECIAVICKIHEMCSQLLTQNPNHQLALDMEFDFIPSMIEELCDIDYDRMEYIFHEVCDK